VRRLHPGVWEKVVDALFWFQLAWIISGFLLMAYFALKIFPAEADIASSHSDPAVPAQRPKLITLGNYRFEVAPDFPNARTNVIELYRRQSDKDAGLR